MKGCQLLSSQRTPERRWGVILMEKEQVERAHSDSDRERSRGGDRGNKSWLEVRGRMILCDGLHFGRVSFHFLFASSPSATIDSGVSSTDAANAPPVLIIPHQPFSITVCNICLITPWKPFTNYPRYTMCELQLLRKRNGPYPPSAGYSSATAGSSNSAVATDHTFKSAGISTDGIMSQKDLCLAIFPSAYNNGRPRRNQLFHNICADRYSKDDTALAKIVEDSCSPGQLLILKSLQQSTSDRPDYGSILASVDKFNRLQVLPDGPLMTQGDPAELQDPSASTAYQAMRMHPLLNRVSPPATEDTDDFFTDGRCSNSAPSESKLEVWLGPSEIRVLSTEDNIPSSLSELPYGQLSALRDLCNDTSLKDREAFEAGMKTVTSLNESGKPQIYAIKPDDYSTDPRKYNGPRMYACSLIGVENALTPRAVWG